MTYAWDTTMEWKYARKIKQHIQPVQKDLYRENSLAISQKTNEHGLDIFRKKTSPLLNAFKEFKHSMIIKPMHLK